MISNIRYQICHLLLLVGVVLSTQGCGGVRSGSNAGTIERVAVNLTFVDMLGESSREGEVLLLETGESKTLSATGKVEFLVSKETELKFSALVDGITDVVELGVASDYIGDISALIQVSKEEKRLILIAINESDLKIEDSKDPIVKDPSSSNDSSDNEGNKKIRVPKQDDDLTPDPEVPVINPSNASIDEDSNAASNLQEIIYEPAPTPTPITITSSSAALTDSGNGIAVEGVEITRPAGNSNDSSTSGTAAIGANAGATSSGSSSGFSF